MCAGDEIMLESILFVACNDKIVDSGVEINLGPEITFDDSALPVLSSGDSLDAVCHC